MNKYRLPENIRPVAYKLNLAPNLTAQTFRGTSHIDLEVDESTSEIQLNAKDLEFESISVVVEGTELFDSYSQDVETETLVIKLSQPLKPGTAALDISFSGAINDKLVGFYISEYDHEGEKHKIASTQFEAPHARRCFPCWDEPNFKATYEISLKVASDLTAISNGEELSTEVNDDGTKLVKFQKTIPLSTYLVAFAIGHFEVSETVDVDGVKVRIVHRPGRSGLNDFALKVASFSLRYLTEYFAIPYQGSKIDFIAIPDFEMGAMENQGCITFRESALLIDENLATQPELQRTADVIAHELAHMWFGNLVTMKWWNGLWLNEAFATFMELKIVDAMFPAWERWADFTISRAQAYAVDATTSTRPIEFEVHSPADAEGMFDILTYEKGASLVRMLEQFIGEDEFREGLRLYMDRNKFSNTETDELWESIQAATTKPIAEMMKSWIFQPGFPIIEAALKGDFLELSQRRANYLNPGSDATLWSVPLAVRVCNDGDDSQVIKTMLVDAQETLKVSDSSQLVINMDGNSFVKVAYSPDLLERNAAGLTKLSSVERFNLIDDAWTATLNGSSSANSFVHLLEAFSFERSKPVWSRIIQGLGDVKHLMNTEARSNFAALSCELMKPTLKSIGMTPIEGESASDAQLRGDLITALGKTGEDPEIQAEAQRTLSVLLRDPSLVDPAIANAVISVSASIGDAADFDNMLQGWRNAQNPQDEQRFLFALPQFPDDTEIDQLLELVRNKEIRSQSVPFLLRAGLYNRNQSKTFWDFIEHNWGFLEGFIGDASKPRMLDGVTKLDHDLDTANRALNFLNALELRVGAKSLAQTLERLKIQLQLRSQEATNLNAHFEG